MSLSFFGLILSILSLAAIHFLTRREWIHTAKTAVKPSSSRLVPNIKPIKSFPQQRARSARNPHVLPHSFILNPSVLSIDHCLGVSRQDLWRQFGLLVISTHIIRRVRLTPLPVFQAITGTLDAS